MVNIDLIDTNKICECGNDLLSNVELYQEVIREMYERINNMPSKTGEWVGQGADRFVDKVNQDYKLFTCIGEELKKFSDCLIDFSNDTENITKKYISNESLPSLSFKYDRMKKTVMPKLDDVVEEILLLKKNISTMYVPNEFKYFDYLKQMDDVFNKWIVDIRNLVSNITEFNNQLSTINSDTDIQISSIQEKFKNIKNERGI